MLQWLKQRLVPTTDDNKSNNNQLDSNNKRQSNKEQELRSEQIRSSINSHVHFYVNNGRNYRIQSVDSYDITVEIFIPYYNFTFIKGRNTYMMPAADIRISESATTFYVPLEPDITFKRSHFESKYYFGRKDLMQRFAENIRLTGSSVVTIDNDISNYEKTCIGAELYTINSTVEIRNGPAISCVLQHPRISQKTLTPDHVIDQYGNCNKNTSSTNHSPISFDRVQLGEVVDYEIRE